MRRYGVNENKEQDDTMTITTDDILYLTNEAWTRRIEARRAELASDPRWIEDQRHLRLEIRSAAIYQARCGLLPYRISPAAEAWINAHLDDFRAMVRRSLQRESGEAWDVEKQIRPRRY